jgi:hypothetical protein
MRALQFSEPPPPRRTFLASASGLPRGIEADGDAEDDEDRNHGDGVAPTDDVGEHGRDRAVGGG